MSVSWVRKRDINAVAVLMSRVRLVRALKYRSYALLWLGQTVSALGDGAYFTALAWLVLILTGSATAMGIVVTASAIPRVMFLLIGGWQQIVCHGVL